MPELPEAETVRRGLAAEIEGSLVEAVEATGARSVRRHAEPLELHHLLAGHRLARVDRHGKYLLLRTDGGEVLVVHLGMSGQLLLAPSVLDRPRHTHAVVRLEGGRELRFVDPRTFGEVFVSAGPVSAGSSRPVELAHLGFDPVTEMPAAGAFAALVRRRAAQLKPLLMGQRVVAGLGNIYTDEVLHAAGLRAGRLASSLTDAEAAALRTHMAAVLRAAIRLGGSSLSDQQYRDVYGRPGRYQERHRVYAREGLPCVTCGTPVARERWSGRSTFFCPRCQR